MTDYMDTPHYRVNKFVSTACVCVEREDGRVPADGVLVSLCGIPLTLGDLEAVVRASAPDERRMERKHVTDDEIDALAMRMEEAHRLSLQCWLRDSIVEAVKLGEGCARVVEIPHCIECSGGVCPTPKLCLEGRARAAVPSNGARPDVQQYAIDLADALRDVTQAMRYLSEDAVAWKEALAKAESVLAGGIRFDGTDVPPVGACPESEPRSLYAANPDAPRCDKHFAEDIIRDRGEAEVTSATLSMLYFARRLERELNAACAPKMGVHQDTKRLDWLEKEMEREHDTTGYRSLFRMNMPITRAAIDEKIAEWLPGDAPKVGGP